eukprot:1144367-Pelagomonas_calceolata.AAC.3
MLLRKLSNPAWQARLACVLLPISTRSHTAYMPTYDSSRSMSYQQECMQIRSGILHTFNRGQRWIIASRNGF